MQTPADFIAAVKRYLRIEEFDIDLAALPENAQAPIFYTPEDDALVQSWKLGDGWNWLNPEFSKIAPWVSRAWSQAQDGGACTAVLVPAAVGSNWWARYVHSKADVVLLNGRIKFVGHKDYYPKDCALLLYSPDSITHGLYEHPEYSVWSWAQDVEKTAA